MLAARSAMASTASHDNDGVIVYDRRKVEIRKEYGRFVGVVQAVKVVPGQRVDERVHDLRLLGKIAFPHVFGRVVLRVIIFAAADIRHVKPLTGLFEIGEVGHVRHHIVDHGRNRAGEQTFVDLGEQLYRIVIVLRRLEHDERALRAARFQIRAEPDTPDDVIEPGKFVHKGAGAVQIVLLAVDETENEVVFIV